MTVQLSDDVKGALERALDEAYELGKKDGFKEAEQVIAAALTRTAATSGFLEQDIDALNLSERPRNILNRARERGLPLRFQGVRTVDDLIRITADELLSITNFGEKSLDEVRFKLGLHGLKLAGD